MIALDGALLRARRLEAGVTVAGLARTDGLPESTIVTMEGRHTRAVVPVIALVETLYRAVEKGHRQTADELHATVLAVGVEIEPNVEADADRATTLVVESRRKATPRHPATLSLGDGMCLATAERLDLPVTGGDLHWETVDLTVPFMAFR